ncbi:MAG: aldehyde ferredoxin oxidoreductase C-terminal domain-containing protein [Atribacterota bacterium]
MNTVANIKGCFAGKILRIDLSNKKIWTEDTKGYAEKTLGGRGINSLIMINEIAPQVKWYDPENLLCFGVGSLVGTMAPGACRVDVSTINVFSGGKGSANVGGFWGAELKYAGYDNIIIIGKSEKPVYLFINDNHVEIRDANLIWGKDVYATENVLRKEIGDEYIKIACIGPAGENRVRGSVIMMDTAKAAGGSGVGCVMGDKKLKAIVVRGHGKIEVAEPEKFMKAVAKCYQKCKEEPNAEMMRKSALNLYSDPGWKGWNTNIVVKNGQDDQWEREKRNRLMNPTTGVPNMQKGVRACYSCPTGCMPFMEINKGRHNGEKGEGFWINTIMGHACRFDISDPESVVESWLLTNKLGLDGDYVAAGLSWVFELYEKGIITKEDTDGLELDWGNSEALIKMIKKLAHREGIGNLLADGMMEAAQKIGHNSKYYLIQVKGQPSIEPFRVPKGWALAVSTSPVAGRHLRGATMGSNGYGPKPRRGDFNVTDYRNQAKGVVWQGKTKELEDNLGICNYVGTWSGANFLTITNFAELINAGMGLNLTEEELMDHYAVIGRNFEKAFNALHTNMSREDDLPPKRFREEEVKSGPYKGFKIEENKYNEMLNEFYELWGWDKKTGMQTRTGLEKLGLKDIAEKLSKCGKLIEK